MDTVDNLPYCYEQVTHSQLCAPAKPQATYPLFHMAYYYVGYLYKYFSYIIKKERRPQSMKITCNKNELTNALQIVARAVASKPQTPILSGIYLRAEGTTLELQATNYEIGLVARIEAEIEEAGELTVGGRYFQEVVRKLPGENVKLACAADEKIVHIESAMAKFTLLSMNAAEFPTIQPLKGNLDFAIKDNILRDLIKKTVFACSNDEARPVFTGCSLEVTENKVTMAATNTHRLSVKSETFDQSIGNIKVIIPSRILQELLHNMSSDIPTDVKISCSYNQISFSFDNLYMTSRLIEGQFPNYRGVIPPEFATHVKTDTASFAAAVRPHLPYRESRCLQHDQARVAGDQIHITSNNPEIGNAEEYIPAEIDGPDIAIAFNAQYIIDVLKNIDSKTCRIGLNQPLSPASIQEEDDDSFVYIVTPVRTNH